MEATWEDGTPLLRSLNDKPDLNQVERVRYIPQTYLEKVCTETEPGQQSEFQKELRNVIFLHIKDADRLGRDSLDELIQYKTEELASQLTAHRQEIARVNTELVRLEAKATPDYLAQLDSKLKLKQKELEAHVSNKPKAVEQPNNLSPEQQAAYATIAADLEKERSFLSETDGKIVANQGRQKALTEHIALTKKIEGKLDNLQTEVTRLSQECAEDLKKLSIDFASIAKISIDKGPLTSKRAALTTEKDTVDASLLPNSDDSLIGKKNACLGRIKSLQDKLDAPNKEYQAYQSALRAWGQQKAAIEGDSETPDTLRYFEAQLKYVKDQLPGEIETFRAERKEHARKAHGSIAAIKQVYEELFAPVQGLIQGSVIIKEGFKLTFNSSIVERTFQRDFFETYINRKHPTHYRS